MKKIITLCVAVLMAAMTVNAKEYKHSLGMVAGLGTGAQYKTMVLDDFTIIAEAGYFLNLNGGTGVGYAGGLANCVLAYQANITEGQGIKLDYYVGGQAKLGGMDGGAGTGAGIFGVGAAGGIEANMTNAPIAFSLDFRPGYAMMFGNGWAGAHMFDYSVNLGVRYTF